MGRYVQHHEPFGRRILNGAYMVAAMRARAERVGEAFRATAPVGEPFEPDDHAGRFRDSAEVTSGDHGGPKHDRAFGRVSVHDPAAMSIEFGHSVRRQDGGKFAPRGTGEEYPHIEGSYTLTRALDAAGDT